jgi:hypothetical protein
LSEWSTAIGARVLKDWDDSCTHLITLDQTMTRKFFLALIDAKPIVTLEFVEVLKSESNLVMPLEWK